MKVIIFTVLIAVAVADRLENTYLPPGSARTAGGNGNFLNTPFGGARSGSFGHRSTSRNDGASFGRPSAQYGAPSTPLGRAGVRRPSAEYGSPSSNLGHQGSGNDGGINNYAQGRYSSSGAGGRFVSAARSRDAGAAILRLNNENYGDGTYRFDYETQNGISQQEAGELKNAGSDYESSSVRGSYTYTGDDGQTYTVNYLADENGFQPFGEHIAEISQAVQTSLQKNAAEAQQGYNQYNGQGSENRAYNQAASRQYLAPNRPGFDQQSGYQY